MKKNRREFLEWTAVAPFLFSAAETLTSCNRLPQSRDEMPHWTEKAFRKSNRSEVMILKTGSYNSNLVALIQDGLKACAFQVRDKRILLKPNLVEQDSQGIVNTHPAVILATVEALRAMGAREVAVGEGCGHQRDSEYVLSTTRLLDGMKELRVDFLDLNLDDVVQTRLKSYYMGVRSLYFPESLSSFDLLISIPKMKTHHWAGVTLAMKNLFGVVPGRIYGWPKNFLHQHDIGRSILDINSTIPIDFCIVDGIIAMQGNGPIQGTAKDMGVLVMGKDPVAVDAACCRLMGIDPQRIDYLRRAGTFLGNLETSTIEQRGERIESLASHFDLPPGFEDLGK